MNECMHAQKPLEGAHALPLASPVAPSKVGQEQGIPLSLTIPHPPQTLPSTGLLPTKC